MEEDLIRQREEAEEARKEWEAEEAKCKKEADGAQEIRDDCESELAKAMPAYNDAIAALNTLDR